MISSTVIPAGADLSSGPSCACAAGVMIIMTSHTDNSAAKVDDEDKNEKSEEDNGRTARDGGFISPILTKREHRS